jgi:hypothetical protein
MISSFILEKLQMMPENIRGLAFSPYIESKLLEIKALFELSSAQSEELENIWYAICAKQIDLYTVPVTIQDKLNLSDKQADIIADQFAQDILEYAEDELKSIYTTVQERGGLSQRDPAALDQKSSDTTIARDPAVVQTKLLQVLEQFNLHVDEKGIVAHEVERYLKGEVLSRDLVPHLTAMLDKPLSEVQAIITALNTEIFKPIQKQIAEEGTIDISYDNDAALQNILVSKKNGSIASKAKPLISFLPKESRVSEEKRADVLSDLRTQGGTPTGTSLLSQEVQKEDWKTTPKTAQKEIDVMLPNTKTYTVDPYRDIL